MTMLLHMCKSKWQTLFMNKPQNPITSININLRNYYTKTSAHCSDFTRTFLKNKCGLSGKALARACSLISFEASDKRPNSVLELFRTFGFSQKHITKICSSDPRLLMYDPHQTLKPKLDFLLSVCSNCETNVHRIVYYSPLLLQRSLDNYLIPVTNLLATVLGSYPNLVTAVIRCPRLFSCSVSYLLPNVKLLQTFGVPHSQISKLVSQYGASGTPIGRRPDEFSVAILKAKELNFDFVSSAFIHALVALMSCDTNLMHGTKPEMFRSFGFSDDEIIYMFKKQPLCFISSADRTRRVVDFLVNKLCWSPSRIANSPNVLLYSLEKRMIPRCSVLQVLESRNVISKRFMLSSVLVMTERKFLKEFVIEHQDKVHEVVDAYKGKIVFSMYTIFI